MAIHECHAVPTTLMAGCIYSCRTCIHTCIDLNIDLEVSKLFTASRKILGQGICCWH